MKIIECATKKQEKRLTNHEIISRFGYNSTILVRLLSDTVICHNCQIVKKAAAENKLRTAAFVSVAVLNGDDEAGAVGVGGVEADLSAKGTDQSAADGKA